MAVKPDTLVHLKGSDMYCTVTGVGKTKVVYRHAVD